MQPLTCHLMNLYIDLLHRRIWHSPQYVFAFFLLFPDSMNCCFSPSNQFHAKTLTPHGFSFSHAKRTKWNRKLHRNHNKRILIALTPNTEHDNDDGDTITTRNTIFFSTPTDGRKEKIVEKSFLCFNLLCARGRERECVCAVSFTILFSPNFVGSTASGSS